MPIPHLTLRAVDELARAQAGHIARWQLMALGMGDGQVTRAARTSGWVAAHRAVWRLPGVQPTRGGAIWAAVLAAAEIAARPRPSPAQRWQEVHEAACRFGASGFTAAAEYGLVDNAPTRPQILLPHVVVRRQDGIRWLRTRVWDGAVVLVEGVPLVTPVRAVWDAARLASARPDATGQVRRMLTKADGLRLIDASRVHEIARAPREHGLPSTVPPAFLRAAASLAAGHSHSGSEHLGRRIVAEVAASLGFTASDRPVDVLDEQGRVVGQADIAIPGLELDIEIDGPHHDLPAQQKADRRRDEGLRRLGWIVRRFRWTMLHEDPEGFRRAVEAEIRQVAAARGIPLRAAA